IGGNREPAAVVCEFFPHGHIALPNPREAHTRMRWVNAPEVAKLHRHAIGIAEGRRWGRRRESVKQLAQFDDVGMPVVEEPLSKVEIECEDQLFSIPSRVTSHRWPSVGQLTKEQSSFSWI